jgi:hypothetical protein
MEKHQFKILKGVLTMNENLETMELTPYEEENEEIMESNERSGMGTGLAMIIGSGLTLAAIAGGKKLKKLWDKHKTKKEQSEVIIIDSTEEVADDSENEEESK